MFRAIAIEYSGEGREVLGLPAEMVGVTWVDFSSGMAARIWLQGWIPEGWDHIGRDYAATGRGESYRSVEIHLVELVEEVGE